MSIDIERGFNNIILNRIMLEFEAAWQAHWHHQTCIYPTGMHVLYPAIIQDKEVLDMHPKLIHPLKGEESEHLRVRFFILCSMFSVDVAYSIISQQTSNFKPATGEEESDTSILQSLKILFLLCLFLTLLASCLFADI